MSEFENQNPSRESAEHQNSQEKLKSLASPKAVEAELDYVFDLMNTNSEERLTPVVNKLEDRLMTLRRQDNPTPEDETEEEQIKRKLDDIDYYLRYRRHRAAAHAYEMDRHPNQRWLDTADTERIQPVVDLIEDAPRLQARAFVELPMHDSSEGPVIVADGDSKHALQIPVSNLVHAQGFESWQDGRGDRIKADGRLSTDKIDDYATRSTDLPPVGQVYGLVQPNGLIIYDVTDGAHRAAAAIKRGQEYLEASQVKLMAINENVVSLGENE